MYLYVIIDCIIKDENVHRYAVRERERGGMLCKLLFFVRDPKLWYSVRDLPSTATQNITEKYHLVYFTLHKNV